MLLWSRTVALAGIAFCAPFSLLAQTLPDTAKIEAIPLELKQPDRYQIPSVLEPIKRIPIVVPRGGLVRSMDFAVGSSVQNRAQIAELDRAMGLARVKEAQAHVREMTALLKSAPNREVVEAQLEAAQARADLAAIELDLCTIRAPFSGRLLKINASSGQYVSAGETIAELADDSSLRVLVPLERTVATPAATVKLDVEGQTVEGKVQTTVPLPESHSPLRELAKPLTGAWVVVPNADRKLEPGQHVLSPSLPTITLATIPLRALRQTDKTKSDDAKVQVVRNEYVVEIPVQLLGNRGAERIQVTGSFRPNDSLIVSSSVPLLAGTLIRFNAQEEGAAGTVEPINPDPDQAGAAADLTSPRTRRSTSSNSAGASTSRGRPTSASTPRVSPTRPVPAAPKEASPPPF